MKAGRSLTELAQEITTQQEQKHDYLVDTRKMSMENGGADLAIEGVDQFALTDTAHYQIGLNLDIPAKYYNKMRQSNPALLEDNVNSWLQKNPQTRMVKTLGNNARAYLSDHYRRLDNYELMETVLPIIGEIPEARVESCEVTDTKLYLKVVNPRLETEVAPGDYVQSGIMISNSEVGLGSVNILPLVYRLVCSNGMIVNDAAQKKRHVGRVGEADMNYELLSTEALQADDAAFMLKVRDIVRATVDEVQFGRVISIMRTAKEAKIETTNIPTVVEVTGREYGLTKDEGEGVLNHLIRGGDLSLYGLANAVTRAAQDVESYDRSTEMEGIGYDMLTINPALWANVNRI